MPRLVKINYQDLKSRLPDTFEGNIHNLAKIEQLTIIQLENYEELSSLSGIIKKHINKVVTGSYKADKTLTWPKLKETVNNQESNFFILLISDNALAIAVSEDIKVTDRYKYLTHECEILTSNDKLFTDFLDQLVHPKIKLLKKISSINIEATKTSLKALRTVKERIEVDANPKKKAKISMGEFSESPTTTKVESVPSIPLTSMPNILQMQNVSHDNIQDNNLQRNVYSLLMNIQAQNQQQQLMMREFAKLSNQVECYRLELDTTQKLLGDTITQLAATNAELRELKAKQNNFPDKPKLTPDKNEKNAEVTFFYPNNPQDIKLLETQGIIKTYLASSLDKNDLIYMAETKVLTMISGCCEYGVYAACDIPAGTLLGEYNGAKISVDKAKEFDKSYAFQTGKEGRSRMYIDAKYAGNMLTRPNHSERLYKIEYIVDEAESGKILVKTVHDIKKDEPLLVDYTESFKLAKRVNLSKYDTWLTSQQFRLVHEKDYTAMIIAADNINCLYKFKHITDNYYLNPTKLIMAIINDDLQAFDEIVRSGADLDLPLLRNKSPHGIAICDNSAQEHTTALMVACYLGKKSYVTALLNTGEKVTVDFPELFSGWTALFYIIVSSVNIQTKIEITNLLIEQGANIIAQDSLDRTCLHLCVEYDQLELAEYILQNTLERNKDNKLKIIKEILFNYIDENNFDIFSYAVNKNKENFARLFFKLLLESYAKEHFTCEQIAVDLYQLFKEASDDCCYHIVLALVKYKCTELALTEVIASQFIKDLDQAEALREDVKTTLEEIYNLKEIHGRDASGKYGGTFFKLHELAFVSGTFNAAAPPQQLLQTDLNKDRPKCKYSLGIL